MINPLVSILCITYNHFPFISDAINGFLIQKTTFPFEILIFDDASTDGTQGIITEFEKKDSRIKSFLQTENQWSKKIYGLNDVLIPQSKGKYIAFCEGDDYWTDPLKLQKQVTFLDSNQDFGLVYSEVDFLYQKNKVLKKNAFKSGIINTYNDIESFLINSGFRAPCTWLFRRSLIESFSLNRNYKDGSFVIMLEIMLHSKVKFMPDSMAVYRYLDNSASHSDKLDQRFRFGTGIFEIQKDYIKKINMSANVNSLVCHRMYPILIPGALALRKIDFIREARVFLRENKKGIKEYLLYLLIQFPIISGKILKIIYKIKKRF